MIYFLFIFWTSTLQLPAEPVPSVQTEPADSQTRSALEEQILALKKTHQADKEAQFNAYADLRESMLPYKVITILLSLIGIGTFLLFLKEWKRRTLAFIAKELKTKSSTLNTLIKEHDEDRNIRLEKRILAVHPPGKNIVQPKLEELGFRQVNHHTLPDGTEPNDAFFQDWQIDDYDIVIFDHLSKEQVDAFTKRCNKDCFVGYNTGARFIPNKQERINFCNSPMTLLARTLEVGRYLNLLQSTKSEV